MLLQPIVENSILHGLSGVGDPCIDIDIKTQDDENIEIIIRDNGYGMNAETVHSLLSDEDATTKKRKGYGVKNVKERIKCYYGENAGIYASSTENEGTEIKISIKRLTKLPQ